MPIERPDEYVHSNKDLAIADSDRVRGGARKVDDRAALYALAGKADQLKENVTVVRVLSDGDHGGAKTKVLLVDLANAGNAAGWQLDGEAAVTAGGYVNALFGPVDEYYFFRTAANRYAPYESREQANARVPLAQRPGRTVNILDEEWWWLSTDTSDAGLIRKTSGPAAVPAIAFEQVPSVVVQLDRPRVAQVYNALGQKLTCPVRLKPGNELEIFFSRPQSGLIVF